MRDLVDAVQSDHDALSRLLDDLEASGDARNRQELLDRAIAELARHWAAEEQHLYPLVRQTLPDGETVATDALAIHAEADQTTKELQRADPTTPRFDTLVTTLVDEVRGHLRDTSTLTRLRETCPPEHLTDLGRKYEQAKKVAPTRPHPAAPTTPPANKVVAPGMALVDRVRDAITRRNT